MPVSVQVPVRVVVDPLALLHRLDDLDAAVETATTRALDNAVAALEERRGGYFRHRARPPELSWTGAGLRDVTPQAAAAAEEVVRLALARAVASTLRGDPTAPGAGTALADRLVADLAEPFAAERAAPLAGLYTVPGYEDGEPTVITFDEPMPLPAGPVHPVWEPVTTGPQMWDTLADRVTKRFGDTWPAQVGVVFQRADGAFVLYVERPETREVLLDDVLSPLSTLVPEVVDGRVVLRQEPFALPPEAGYRLRYLGPGTSTEQRGRTFTEFYGAGFARAIRADVPEGTADPDTVVAGRLAEAAHAWAATTVPAGTRCFLVLQVDGQPSLLPCPYDIAADLDADLVPVTTFAPSRARPGVGDGGGEAGAGAGAGGGGGAAAADGENDAGWGGPRGGQLGTAEGHGRLSPVAGLGGEELLCLPYLGEPAAADLVDDHGLRLRMAELAVALEIPECGYLGRFAVNAARVVATRARAIGLASVRATATNDVTVRPDGGGNNGFVDVRPGASPEFEYLRLLAGIAADVHRFGSDVADAYLDHTNSHLVRPAEDSDPSAGAWVPRFFGEFRDAVRGGYRHLYAETCRVLLLQQLRTSRQGIDARRDEKTFERTLNAFTQTLDILGETVVQLSTLRRAIRHSATVYVTGSVRHVLSVPETTTSPGTGEPIDLPPPIDVVPQRIIAAVGEARVERRDGDRVAVWKGRPWTVAELDEAIGDRRTLINQVEPLFLQVSDLETLYAGLQRDPGTLRRYLTALLEDMDRANSAMRDGASHPDKGAFFALKASQYLKREGGRDWRGLRYNLQGIHALADDQLRGPIGHDPLYVQGVNAAIDKQANFDTFLTHFATVGIIALGLLCAPLGAVAVGAITGLAGLALTWHDVAEADRQSDLYRALVDDHELFLRWQEVQLAQFMASLSIAFSVVDALAVGRAARVIVGSAGHALRVAERAGVTMAVRSVSRSTRREVIRNTTREVLENAVREAVSQAAITAALDRLLPAVITPVLVPWLRQTAMEHGTLDEVEAALGALAAGLPAPTAAPPAAPTPPAAQVVPAAPVTDTPGGAP